ncbi:hypothetical protein KUL113_07860 [Tenacibaculum sp. KUL113]|nr:hypothetical protein KUL113_07860 [Tenacibaculum sp. KUL113]
MENLDTRVRSDALTVRSTNGHVEFLKQQFDSILLNRNAFQWNRIRAVIFSPEETFFSDEFKLYVGVTILALAFEEKVKIAAMVDNASVIGYDFEAMLVVWHKDGTDTTSFGNRISNGQRDFLLEDYSIMDWGNSKLGYLGPDNDRFVRTQILYD